MQKNSPKALRPEFEAAYKKEDREHFQISFMTNCDLKKGWRKYGRYSRYRKSISKQKTSTWLWRLRSEKIWRNSTNI